MNSDAMLRRAIADLEGGYTPIGPTIWGIDARHWPTWAARVRASANPRTAITLDEAVGFYKKNFIAAQIGTTNWSLVYNRHPGLAIALLFNLLHGAPAGFNRKGEPDDAYDLLSLQSWWQPSNRRIRFAWDTLASFTTAELNAVAARLHRDYPKMLNGRIRLVEGGSMPKGVTRRVNAERAMLLQQSSGGVAATVSGAVAGAERAWKGLFSRKEPVKRAKRAEGQGTLFTPPSRW